ncbi:P-loop containing nucleoside triphosphate hydrolase protein [Favolaschia claudopus]|uniref:DNA 3'-5' helicase n=1 Tax=Favolaschia claudopus TaxID=2862362 RepID=A0AAW0BZ04_9AGAR
MASKYRWTDTQGRQTVKEIVRKLIPQWPNGLYSYQEDIILRVLDGQDVLCCVSTGGGKSAMFAVPIIVLREMIQNPHLYPSLPTRAKPVGIVITPTKGLAWNIVYELEKLSVPAFAYCHETVTDARKNKRDLVKIIRECNTYRVICVDPEHLHDKAWRSITASDTFRANAVYGCLDEVHLVNEWGASFRPLFKRVGAFFRGSLPSTISVMGLSATLQPGAPTDSICKSLGFSGNDFYLLRLSNERPNTQFIMEALVNGVGSTEFPQLLPYLNSGRKGIIHCVAIDDLFRVYMYLWNSLPEGLHRLRRIRTYHSIRTSDYNKETIRLLEDDPMCQVVIATIAFANGVHAPSLLDSYSIGIPDPDALKQQGGRAGRRLDIPARAFAFYQPSMLLDAIKQLDILQALLLTEQTCYVAVWNRIYQNPPLSTTTLNCIAAKRPLPCSLCAKRANITLSFPSPPLPDHIVLPPFTPPAGTQPIVLSASDKKLQLKKKERELASAELAEFGNKLRLAEQRRSANIHRPKSSYFPVSISTLILDKFLSIDSVQCLSDLVQPWIFARTQSFTLYDVILDLQATIRSDRETARLKNNAKQSNKSKSRRKSKKKKKVADSSESEDMEEVEVEESEVEHETTSSGDDEGRRRSSPVPPPAKRTRRSTVLDDVTNQAAGSRRQTTADKTKITSAAISATYRPAYRTTATSRRNRG